jgi:mono/diheme cytochrome c family protein
MFERRNTNSHSKLLTIFIGTVALLAALMVAACKSNSVVSDNGARSAQANTSASPGAESSQAGAAPVSAPTAPVGPVGLASPAPQGAGGNGERRSAGSIPVTVMPAKPPLTPEPDPFPPRPTPTVVIKDGKVVQQWQAPAEAANLVNPVKSKPDAAKLGREFYMQKCVDCHGKAGQGNGWMSASVGRNGKKLPPTNLASQMVQANTDGELFWKITNGRSPMPVHRVRFDDEQRWYIVTFLRTLKK